MCQPGTNGVTGCRTVGLHYAAVPLPDLPSIVISRMEDLMNLKSAAVIPHIVLSAFSPFLYVYTAQSTPRNLFRIRLR
jgi:hypothetical protein